ncbi:MAG: DUF1592 domain-containing protein [Verrucomicrobia bacterium]|nr:DUF1592 domain-containing protein [Verrucomicrobiota bacterium]MBI3867487.1 DUF1592 domain-containing protein [Verrucomicrobiota bacterium]
MLPCLQRLRRVGPGRVARWLAARRLAASLWIACPAIAIAAPAFEQNYQQSIQPILQEFCYDCHGDGMSKGQMALDSMRNHEERTARKDLWWAVLRNTRAGLMPPHGKPRPSREQLRILEEWILADVFALNPRAPDPGRVTIRRLNRAEYRNTVRDLLGVDFKVDQEFPADDTGHGFDNIGEVLTLSPMQVEKYLAAARSIVEQAVPTTSRVAPEVRIAGARFQLTPAPTNAAKAPPGKAPEGLALSYYTNAVARAKLPLEHTGRYHVKVDVTANEKFVDGQFDLNRCRLRFKVDGVEWFSREFTREAGRAFHFDFDRDLEAGERDVEFAIEPTGPAEKQVRSLTLRLDAVVAQGPDDPKFWVKPKGYEKHFPREIPYAASKRRSYAREIIARFAARAFRRQADPESLDRLVAMAENFYSHQGKTFEFGVSQAMVATLASPHFLFREETPAPLKSGERHPDVDERSLASRLSYFLWSTMPDDELIRLADQGRLRARLGEQVQRMIADARFGEWVRNFAGQWLQTRDVESVPIDFRAVMTREIAPDPEVEQARKRFRELREKPAEQLTASEKADFEKARQVFFKSFGRFNRYDLTGDLRRAMRLETEKCVEYVVREDRSLLELLDSDYTFLNERLAEHYGIPNVKGEEMRRVSLGTNSPRGGVLTQGSVLVVTANPTRTSPVKRGLFILENIFGLPPPPPPPNIPALEDSVKKSGERQPSLRETLAVHREKPLCASCHNRMDPLGLAFENFNALGRWRDAEFQQPLDPTGRLITGERFADASELKRVLVRDRRDDFYRCLAEKALTYALGRGLDYYDTDAVDRIVERLRQSDGRASGLLRGVIESAAFQKMRAPQPATRRLASTPSSRNASTPHSP